MDLNVKKQEFQSQSQSQINTGHQTSYHYNFGIYHGFSAEPRVPESLPGKFNNRNQGHYTSVLLEAALISALMPSKGAHTSLHQHFQHELVNEGIKKYCSVLLKKGKPPLQKDAFRLDATGDLYPS